MKIKIQKDKRRAFRDMKGRKQYRNQEKKIMCDKTSRFEYEV